MASSPPPLLWTIILLVVLVTNPSYLCDAKAKDYTKPSLSGWHITSVPKALWYCAILTNEVGPLMGRQQVRSLHEFLANYDSNDDIRILTDVVSDTEQFDLVVSPSKLSHVTRYLDTTSTPYTQTSDNLQRNLRMERRENAQAHAQACHRRSVSDDDVVEPPHYYMEYDQINDYLKRIVNASRGRAELFYIGKSYEGRAMYVVRVNNGKDKPKLWIDAGIHAREWIAHATALHILHQVVFNESWAVQCVADSFTWFFLPVVNPDGFAYTWTGDRMWRKNRHPNCGCSNHESNQLELSKLCKKSPSKSCDERIGVDLNRNFDFNWGPDGDSVPSSDNFQGTSPFSEPEAQNMRDFLWVERHNMHIYISLHCYMQAWVVPWAGQYYRSPDYPELERVANASARAIFDVHGEVYDVGQFPEIMYLATGTSMDWVKNASGVKYSYTIELRPTVRNPHYVMPFHLPPSQIKPTGEEILAGVLSTAHLVKQRIEMVGKDGL